MGWPLRGAGGGCAAARLEQGSKAHTALGRKTERPHEGAFLFSGGEGGIRTHERLQTFAGFQDQCIQPLCHLSELSCAPGGMDSPPAAAHPFGAHFVRPDSLRESVEPTKGYKPLLVFKTSALTRAIPGARPAGGLTRRILRLALRARFARSNRRPDDLSRVPLGHPAAWSTALPALRRTACARALCLQYRFDSTRAGAIPRTLRCLAGLIPRNRV